MPENIRGYLRRRYRWALGSIVGGATGALLAGAALGHGSAGLAFQGACAIVWGGALVVAGTTRCPKCHVRFAERAGQVLPVLVWFSLGTPPQRCPHCHVSLDEPRP